MTSHPVPLQTGIDTLKNAIRTLPETPGVYRMLNAKGDVLYVGKAKNLKRRVTNYIQINRLTKRHVRMVSETRHLEVITTETEIKALLLESNLIKSLRPRYNILLRDDKSFPYIFLTGDHDFPQVMKHRGTQRRKGDYYGPFASAWIVDRTIHGLQKALQLRNCSDSIFNNRTRPCLQYHIKRCSAPCVGKVSIDEYAAQCTAARSVLEGLQDNVIENLKQQMLAASDALDFEKAAMFRDRIRALNSLYHQQGLSVAGIDKADLIALYQEGGLNCVQVFFIRNGQNYGNQSFFPDADAEEEADDVLGGFIMQFYQDKPPPPTILCHAAPTEPELLAEGLSELAGHKVILSVPQRGEKRTLIDHVLQNARDAHSRRMVETSTQQTLRQGVMDLFDLPELPRRIEVYDNSHLMGSHALGAMIVAGPEGFMKTAYRKFNIKDADTAPGDDFAMMREMLTRRFKRSLAEDPDRQGDQWPDLLLIDGGVGQLNVAAEVLAELGLSDLPLVAISKGPDRNAGREQFHRVGQDMFQLPENDPVLFYLQRLRDEAHRFAIESHRGKRKKAIIETGLDDVPGIGPTRKRALILHFGSAKAVRHASLADLEAAPGITRRLARQIYDFFHS